MIWYLSRLHHAGSARLLLRVLRAPVPSSLRQTRSSRPNTMRHMAVALQFVQSPRLRASPWATTVAPQLELTAVS